MQAWSRRMMIFVVLAAAGGLVAICPRVPAEEKPAAAPKKAEPEIVHIEHADVVEKPLTAGKLQRYQGHVRIRHLDTVLLTEDVVVDEQAGTATFSGKLTITSSDSDITGSRGIAYFKKRTGVVEGDVVMIIKPKKSENPGSDKENPAKQPTTVSCPKIEYNYRKKIITATGGVSFKQPNRSMHADKAIFDQNKEFLVLTGNVSAVDEKGQEFSAPGKVEISLKEGDEWMRAENASATFKIEADEGSGD